MRNINTWFMNTIDLSTQVSNILENVARVRAGIPARLYAIGLTILAIAAGAVTWYFDYAATIEHAAPIIFNVASALNGLDPFAITVVAWSLTISPTLVEMMAPNLSRASFTIATVFYFCLAFDMVTDYPRVLETVGLYHDMLGNWFVRVIATVLLLFFASIGFELLFVMFAVSAVYLWLRG